VLLSERNPEPGRINRLQALPPGGLPTLVAFRGKARHIQIEGGRAFASTRSQPQDKDKGSAKPPDGPKLDEGCFDETQLAEGWIDPLYLIACGLSWRTQRDSGAGWELIGCLKLSGSAARIAAAFLVETKNVHLATPERALVAGWFPQAVGAQRSRNLRVWNAVAAANTPYGLEIIENCVTCKLRRDKWFCGLSPEVLKSFSAASHLSTYPGGAILFVEGQTPRGVVVLCTGKVKLSTTSRDGKVLILKMAEPGEALGLSAVISGTPYELTAETAGPCQVNFIDRESLMKLLGKYGELGLHSARALSREFQSAYRDIHELVLARSSAGKLARLLLSWSAGRELDTAGREIRIRSNVTHEEIAQMIGSSRETVTRLLSELKKKELIRLEGSTLVIRNRTALEALAA
jgi:CRP/FNR family transcriptional regulator, cyclic AMP receptor protein